MFPGPRSVDAVPLCCATCTGDAGPHCRCGERRGHWQDGSGFVPLPCLHKRPRLRTWPLPCPGSRATSNPPPSHLASASVSGPRSTVAVTCTSPRDPQPCYRGKPSQTPAQAHAEHRGEVLLFRKHLSMHSAHHRCRSWVRCHVLGGFQSAYTHPVFPDH